MRKLEEQLGIPAASEILSMDEHYAEQSQSQVLLPGGRIKISATAEAIAKNIAPAERIFLRDGIVWYLRKDEDGVCKLHSVTPAKARSLLEDYCEFKKPKLLKDGRTNYTDDVMSEATAKAVIASEAFINRIPEIRGISRVPFPLIGKDKMFRMVENGYDAEAKILISGDSKSIRSDLPVKDAVSTIRDLYRDFNFLTKADEARCIAGLLTPTFRRAGVVGKRIPMEICEADQSQSGKTLLQQIKAAVHRDRPEYVTERKKGVGGTEENFETALLSGRPFVLLDNFRGNLDNSSLESFLTAEGKFNCRGLRQGGAVDPENYFLSLTSNGVKLTPDLANRSCFVRIRKQPPDFEFKDYGDCEFIDFVKENYEIYLTAVYSILKAWNDQGRPKTKEKGHSFRLWARSMDWIVQNYFKLPPLLEGHQDALKRTVSPDLLFFRALAIKLAEEEDFSNKSFRAAELVEKCMAEGLNVPGIEDSSRIEADARNMAFGKILTRVMDGNDKISLDGFTMSRHREKYLAGGSHGDKVGWLYTFARL